MKKVLVKYSNGTEETVTITSTTTLRYLLETSDIPIIGYCFIQ